MRLMMGLLVFALMASSVASAADDERMASIRKGTVLHDAGNYKAALQIYQELLASSPDDTLVLYEASLTLMSLKNYAKCIEYAQRASEIESAYQAGGLSQLASCQDDAGLKAESLATFERATALFPKDVSLNFNYGVTLLREGDTKKAAKSLQVAIEQSPAYSSPYLIYAKLLEAEKKQGAAVLMYLRFLMSEPKSPRAVGTATRIKEIVGGMVKSNGAKGTNINLSIDDIGNEPDSDKLTSLNLMLGIMGAAAMDESKARNSNMPVGPMSTAVLAFNTLQSFGISAVELLNDDSKQQFFWKTAVVPLQHLTIGNVETAFYYHVLSLAEITGGAEWEATHKEDIDTLFVALAQFNQSLVNRR